MICSTQIPSFKQLVDGPPTAANTPPEEAVHYYVLADTMVEYLLAHFGADSYKQLLSAYRTSADPKVNYPLVLKMTPDEFYSGWVTFAKKKYC